MMMKWMIEFESSQWPWTSGNGSSIVDQLIDNGVVWGPEDIPTAARSFSTQLSRIDWVINPAPNVFNKVPIKKWKKIPYYSIIVGRIPDKKTARRLHRQWPISGRHDTKSSNLIGIQSGNRRTSVAPTSELTPPPSTPFPIAIVQWQVAGSCLRFFVSVCVPACVSVCQCVCVCVL